MAATIESVLAAIKQHESGGDYTAINSKASASGAYQMLDGTWQSALRMAGLGNLGAQYKRAYQAPPDIQDKAAMALAMYHYNNSGGRLDAIPAGWYLGHTPSAAEMDQIPRPDAGNTITVRSFVDYVMSRAGDPNATDTSGQFDGFDKPPADLTDDEILAKIQADYGGAYSWLINDPELRATLISGVRDGWDDAKIIAAVQSSGLYKRTSDAQRAWMSTYATNPGQAAQQVTEALGNVKRLARYLGISLTQERAQLIAWNFNAYGWDGEHLQRAILDEANWHGRHIGEFGQLGVTVTQVKQEAESYGLTLDRDRALALARDVLSGSATIESISGGFKNQAKALFPAFADDLDAGMRLADIAQPYMQTAAQLLEKNPAEMRLTDPMWAAPLTRRQNGKPSPMSLDEWTTHVMTDKKYGWDQTNNAMGAAANFVQELGNMFGVF